MQRMAKVNEFLIIKCFPACVFVADFAALLLALWQVVLLAMTGHGTVRSERGKQLLALHEAWDHLPLASQSLLGYFCSRHSACHIPQFLRN